MNNTESLKKSYEMKVRIAINALKSGDFDMAMISTLQAVLDNQDLPEYHNLLGLIAEHHKDFALACRHYRASYALDPSYKPALHNLERLTNQKFGTTSDHADFGDVVQVEEPHSSIFLYELLNHRKAKRR